MARASVHGVVLVDKPRGLSSHDVVARVRRFLGERRVGHAGTLDPMATGLLVVLVGDATRLADHLSASSKRYVARVVLGAATDSLDADGQVTEAREIPRELAAELAASTVDRPAESLSKALAGELARTEQVPPSVSAIHVDGVRAYERIRRGQAVELAPRPVSVRAVSLRAIAVVGGSAEIDVELDVSKGYYVRSFARDLGVALGVPAHLGALRRVASGPFDVEDAVPLDPERVRAALLPIPRAMEIAMPLVELTDEGAARARCGKALSPEHFASTPPEGPCGWMHQGEPIAIASGTRLVRGFPASGIGRSAP